MNERIKEARKKSGLSQGELAKALNIGKTTLIDYEKGVSEPRTSTIVKISEICNVPLEWLLTGKSGNKGIYSSDDEVEVNLFEDIFASAGYGATNSNIKPRKTTLSKAFIESLHINNPNRIDIIRIVGDSMEPDFSDGEYVVIERVDSLEDVRNGNTIVANIDGELYIKKIKKEPLTKKIYLLSTNSFYEPIELKDELIKNFNLIGIVRGKYRAI